MLLLLRHRQHWQGTRQQQLPLQPVPRHLQTHLLHHQQQQWGSHSAPFRAALRTKDLSKVLLLLVVVLTACRDQQSKSSRPGLMQH